MSDYEIREKVLTDAMEELKKKAAEVINGVMSDLYTDYLSHVVSDTDANISYRVEGCLKNILEGKATLVTDTLFTVNDRYGNDHIVSLNGNTTYLEALANAMMPLMGEIVMKQRIKELETQVSNLKHYLEDAYRLK